MAACSSALTETGEGFAIGASYGAVMAPDEVEDATEALQLADRRMYAQKGGGRMSAGRQSRDVLLSTLTEREPELGEHLHDVAKLALAVGRELDMSPEDLDEVARAAELHDVGKVAIPDAILNKPGPLDEAEWGFMRRHTIIGERILLSAPALRPVARLVRSSHERWDGSGYPDGLAGEEIPLGRPDRVRLRRLRRDDHRPPLPPPHDRARPRSRAGGQRRQPVRPARGGRVRAGARRAVPVRGHSGVRVSRRSCPATSAGAVSSRSSVILITR